MKTIARLAVALLFTACLALLARCALRALFGEPAPPGGGGEISAAEPGDLRALLALADARVGERSTAREQAEIEADLTRLEARILAGLGEPHDPAELARLARRGGELDELAQRLDAEAREMAALAAEMRACLERGAFEDPGSERPDWIDRARVLLRVAELEAAAGGAGAPRP